MIKQIFLGSFYCIFLAIAGNACCAERNYRLLPLGEVKNDFVFLELDFFRHCNNNEGGGIGNEFWFAGSVNIVKFRDDSIYTIKQIAKLDTLDCVCHYKNHFELSAFDAIMMPYYSQALNYARELKNFRSITTSTIHFNDTINSRVEETVNDSTYKMIVQYGDIFNYDLALEEVLSCYPTQVAEVRTYLGKNQKLTILRLRCQVLSDEAILVNRKKFQTIETAFWKEAAQWHGLAKDFLIVSKTSP